MVGLGDVIRLLLEKSWTLGVLLAVTGGGTWYAVTHGQRMPAVVGDWAPLAALLGFALIVLSTVSAATAKAGALFASRRAALREATEAVANLSTLSIAEFHALAEVLDDGVTRISIHHGSILASVWRKGLVRQKRKENALQSICEIHPAVVAVKDEIVAQWKEDVREGCLPDPPGQGRSWLGG